MIQSILKTISAPLKKKDKAVLVKKLKPQRNSQVNSNGAKKQGPCLRLEEAHQGRALGRRKTSSSPMRRSMKA